MTNSGDGAAGDAADITVTVVADDGTVHALPPAEPVRLAKASGQVEDAQMGGRYLEPRIAYDDLLRFLDLNTWHRRCVEVKALLTVGLGWSVERGGAEIYDSVSGEGDTADPAVALLLRPSADDPLLTMDDVLYRNRIDYHATGDAYLEVVRDAAGRVAELYHVPARTMRRTRDRRGFVQTKGTKRSEPWPAYGRADATGKGSSILHTYVYDPLSDDYGMPGWVGALASMGLDRTVLEFNTRLFQNGLMAHHAVVVKGGKLSDAGRAAVKQFLRDQATGAKNAGRVLLLEVEDDGVSLEFTKLNLDIKDLMLTGIQNHFRDVVIAAHGVLPRLLGVVTPGQLGATGEVEGQLRIFREAVLRPEQRRVETMVNTLLGEVEAGEGEAREPARFVLKELDITALDADARLLDVLLSHGILERGPAADVAERLLAG